ncbi:hypothetical protein LCGC14_1926310 [marine sediment metagenome]|uniref:C2H2-type domain-containing protein n=1 Tax=marine sediment metagenome TaxID=412755 RepID=A0A0F9GCR2_9ZZZZ|nr:hypothetical protein [bacterium]
MRNIHIDGGTKRNLACIVDEEMGFVKLRKIRKTNDGSTAIFEFEALITALTYIQKRVINTGEIIIHTDSTEIVRFARYCKSDDFRSFNKLKMKCFRKIHQVSEKVPLQFHWLPRNHNLAGKVLEYYNKRKIPRMEFIIKSHICRYCKSKYISKRDLQRHIYNRHVMFSS